MANLHYGPGDGQIFRWSTHMTENELYHYGVLGMKWGVRKDARNGTVNKISMSKSEKKNLQKAAKKLKSGKISEWSNAMDLLMQNDSIKRASAKLLPYKQKEWPIADELGKHYDNFRNNKVLIDKYSKKYKSSVGGAHQTEDLYDLYLKDNKELRKEVDRLVEQRKSAIDTYVGVKSRMSETIASDISYQDPKVVNGISQALDHVTTHLLFSKELHHSAFGYRVISSNELYHYGILGMKWGIRRYQPYRITGPRKDGKTGEEIGEAARETRKERRAKQKEAKKLEKQLKKNKEKAEKEQKREELNEQKRELIRKTSSPAALARNADLFTTAELNDLKNRIQIKEQLKNLSKNKTDRVASYLNTANNVLGTSISLYNNAAMVSNAHNLQNGKLTKENFRNLITNNIQVPEQKRDSRQILGKILADQGELYRMSDQEIMDVTKRVTNMMNIEKTLFPNGRKK